MYVSLFLNLYKNLFDIVLSAYKNNNWFSNLPLSNFIFSVLLFHFCVSLHFLIFFEFFYITFFDITVTVTLTLSLSLSLCWDIFVLFWGFFLSFLRNFQYYLIWFCTDVLNDTLTVTRLKYFWGVAVAGCHLPVFWG